MEGNGLKEFKAWLDRNKNQFKTYTIEDIMNLAIACGFDRNTVAAWGTSQRFREAI